MIAVSHVKYKNNNKGLHEFACRPCAGPCLTSRLHLISVCVQPWPMVETHGGDPLGQSPVFASLLTQEGF